ncbi:unnamed protein product [Cyprideis torosa]|uniref:Uncharacterized protein n=1 Tax=Cyprideis torosa TaxID=163714 RepID=A0A7R8ZUB2_9CRUS|nr:unnamed protein product [Cyprideis torosa]CAG0900184.1 unnamed protein product [Cyprideis torosa]
MKISLNWLRDHVETKASAEEICDLLTQTGLEVEGTQELGPKGGLEGFVVGEVLAVEKHPNADRLKLTKVDVGNGVLDIVCGAPNVAEGMKVPVAMIGTKIFDTEGKHFEIKKSKIRGAESFGMLCSERELQIGDDASGILSLDKAWSNGVPLKDLISFEKDTVLEIGLTPNRSDAMSHRGVAKDLYAALKSRGAEVSYKEQESITVPQPSLDKPHVTVEEATEVVRYMGVQIKGVTKEEGTLEDREIEQIMKKLVGDLEKKHQAQLRGM